MISFTDQGVTGALLTCSTEDLGSAVRFELRQEGERLRWYLPDNTATGLVSNSVSEARRLIMFNASHLARKFVGSTHR